MEPQISVVDRLLVSLPFFYWNTGSKSSQQNWAEYTAQGHKSPNARLQTSGHLRLSQPFGALNYLHKSVSRSWLCTWFRFGIQQTDIQMDKNSKTFRKTKSIGIAMLFPIKKNHDCIRVPCQCEQHRFLSSSIIQLHNSPSTWKCIYLLFYKQIQ